MPRVSDRHIRQLQPYLVGESPRANGEWDMYCPLHEDSKRSASLNVLSGVWYCQAECGGGGVIDLIRRRSQWVPRDAAATNGNGSYALKSEAPAELITMAKIEGWHSNLLSEETVLDEIVTERGIHTKTLIDFKIGYRSDHRAYTIPVFGPDGEIWNVRYYNMHPVGDRRKIWSSKGMRVCELYPFAQLEADRIVVCEGEWDALITIQNGYPAVTRTASADTWRNEWNEYFNGKQVYLAHDADEKGQLGNRKVGRALNRIAEVKTLTLPYEIVPKHGKDMTDFWLEHDRSDMEQMMSNAEPWGNKGDKHDAEIITVLDAFDALRVGDPVKLQVTIKGKKEPGYSIPRKATLSCTRDAGAKCQVCSMNPAGGEMKLEIEPQDPDILGMIGEGQTKIFTALAGAAGVPGAKCSRLEIDVTEHQAVEILFGRPSIDHADGTKTKDYKNITVTSVGRHDTESNNTVVITGALHPSPKDQRNEFLAWEVQKQETSVDRFEMTRFQPRSGQRPLAKLGQINRELAAHVTRIVGRPEMHALMDLTFHSALSFKFGGQIVHRGWLESLVVGDTRTGKSEAAERFVRHFGAGEVVGGEAATLAGLVGGMQQIGGKDWTVTWGVIPINDRRIVVIDELSGLSPEDIGKMSDVRASGMARITKILQEVTYARTRLLWLGNPRFGGMDQFTYGVDAIRPLIGSPEDIARFDLAMAVNKTDVVDDEYNKRIETTGELRYTSDACHTMLMWCWTRQTDQIVWAKGAEDEVYKMALDFGRRYVEDPPIVQAANARIKIARVAVALAARTFSTDDSCEKVIITKEHVQDAVKFMDMLYEMPAFGYADRSRERLDDTAEAVDNIEDTRHYLLERRGLAKFLLSNAKFRRPDLEEVLNLDRDSANAIISRLWQDKMIRKEGADNRVEPTLHGILRDLHGTVRSGR
jgi:hypothetical protein